MVIDHYWLPGGEHASRTAMGDDRTDRQLLADGLRTTTPESPRRRTEMDKSDKTKRTEMLLKRERGGENEFVRLHAILCLDHGFHRLEGTERFCLDDHIDSIAIAKRLDEILAEAREGLASGEVRR
jgi:hypothetical protein